MKAITNIPNTFFADYDYITTIISNEKDYYTFEARSSYIQHGQSDEGHILTTYQVTRRDCFNHRYMGLKNCTEQEFIDLFNLFTSFDFVVIDQWDSTYDWDLAEIEEYEAIFELKASK